VPPNVTQLGAPSIRPNTLLYTLYDPHRGDTVNPTSYIYVSGGNPQFQPESSKTTSFGVIIEPERWSTFRASLDYTRLEKTDNIRNLPAALSLEYEDQFPGRVVRGPGLPTDGAGWAGPITYLDTSLINAAAATYETLDAQLKYGFDLPRGFYVEVWGNGTWTLKAEQQTVAGGPTSNLRGISARYGNAVPLNFRGFYGVNVERDAWAMGWTVHHYSSYLVADPQLSSSGRMLAAQGNGGRVPRQILHDAWVSWRADGAGGRTGPLAAVLSKMEISGGIRNVFNTRPEVDVSSDYQYYSYLVDPRLRTYYVQAKYAF